MVTYFLGMIACENTGLQFQQNDIIHISQDGENLVSGRILWVHGCYIAAEFTAGDIKDSAAGISLFYQQARKFVQQPVAMEGMLEQQAAEEPTADHALALDLDTNADRAVVVYEVMGEPEIADNRECYRVRTASFGVQVQFADREDCELMDISGGGFAVLTDQSFQAGDVVQTRLPQGDDFVQGRVRIQSARRLRDGRYRYGVVCLGVKTEQACSGLAVELQRKQLQRHAGLVAN